MIGHNIKILYPSGSYSTQTQDVIHVHSKHHITGHDADVEGGEEHLHRGLRAQGTRTARVSVRVILIVIV